MSEHICKCQQPACTCPNNWALCKYCGADVTWVRTDNDRAMAIDGHIKAGQWDRHTQRSHWATCTNPPARKRPVAKPKAPKPVNPKQTDMFAEFELQKLRDLRAVQQGGAR